MQSFLRLCLVSHRAFQNVRGQKPSGLSTNRPRRVTVQLVDTTSALRAVAFLMKGPDDRGLEQKEETMKLISNHELHERSESELAALFFHVSKGLVRTERGSRLWVSILAQKLARLTGKHQPGARYLYEYMTGV